MLKVHTLQSWVCYVPELYQQTVDSRLSSIVATPPGVVASATLLSVAVILKHIPAINPPHLVSECVDVVYAVSHIKQEVVSL